MKYEESALSKALPTEFIYNQFKVCETITFVSFPMIFCTLTFDLSEKRFRCFISAVRMEGDYLEEDYEERAIYTITNGCELPHRLIPCIFKTYFMQEEMMKLLDKDLKLFVNILKILDEK